MKKRVLIGGAILVAIGVAGAYGYYQAMVHGLIRYNEFDIRTEGQLQVGDLAPDLVLSRVSSGDMEGEDGGGAPSTLLSDLYREKPVILAFGSYT